MKGTASEALLIAWAAVTVLALVVGTWEWRAVIVGAVLIGGGALAGWLATGAGDYGSSGADGPAVVFQYGLLVFAVAAITFIVAAFVAIGRWLRRLASKRAD